MICENSKPLFGPKWYFLNAFKNIEFMWTFMILCTWVIEDKNIAWRNLPPCIEQWTMGAARGGWASVSVVVGERMPVEQIYHWKVAWMSQTVQATFYFMDYVWEWSTVAACNLGAEEYLVALHDTTKNERCCSHCGVLKMQMFVHHLNLKKNLTLTELPLKPLCAHRRFS